MRSTQNSSTQLRVTTLSSVHYAAAKLSLSPTEIDRVRGSIERQYARLSDAGQGPAFPTFTEAYLKQKIWISRRLLNFFIKCSQTFLDWLAADLRIEVKKSSIQPMWGNIHRAGQYHAPHNHAIGECLLSGVFYLAGPTTRRTEGFLVLETTNIPGVGGRFDLVYRPDAKVYIQPTPGTLVLFPSFVRHYVTPHTSNSVRISLAFNVSSNVVLGQRKSHSGAAKTRVKVFHEAK